MKSDRIILGIDPGTNILGYGLIQNKGTKITLIKMGIIHLGKIKDHATKLKMIFERVLAIIEEYKPDEMAIEAPFYGKNVQSMLKLGRAQGVAMASALYRDIPIFEYAPRKIKQSITGNGNASKEQVASMLINLININPDPQYLDETDGVAVAVCHYFQGNQHSNGKKYSNWKSYIADNPNRINK